MEIIIETLSDVQGKTKIFSLKQVKLFFFKYLYIFFIQRLFLVVIIICQSIGLHLKEIKKKKRDQWSS